MAQFEGSQGFSHKEGRKRILNNKEVYRRNSNLRASVINQVAKGEGKRAADALRREFN